MIDGYIPQNERKKILFLADDLRLPSGIAVMSKEIILGLAHKFNFIQLGAGINHPDVGKVLDLSQSINEDIGITDSYVKIYPYNGYGDAAIIHQLMEIEKPDAILHFTDPRQWIWLYQIEAELRQHVPLFFYHIWDNVPYPKYNELFYRSCDWIGCISKQTYNIVKNVWVTDPPKDWQVSYVPHGINSKNFFPITEPEQIIEMETVRNQLFQDNDVRFSVLYNNRNIHRKQPGNVILAFQRFLQGLPEEEREFCRLVMHTNIVDNDGTDLAAIFRDVAPDVQVVFSDGKLPVNLLNALYNVVDVTINLASNEGFGLSTAESIMTGTPIIANVTGGLQDQMGFKIDGRYMTHLDFNKEWGTNHDGRLKDHGEWAVPVFPSNRTLIGSILTPFIFDDRCKWEDAGDAIRQVYDWGKDERKRRGLLGREWVLNEGGLNAGNMCDLFDKHMTEAFKKWKPTERVKVVRL